MSGPVTEAMRAHALCMQEEKAQREDKKSQMARLVLAGQSSFTSDESDVFEGLSPHEIQVFVDEVWFAMLYGRSVITQTVCQGCIA